MDNKTEETQANNRDLMTEILEVTVSIERTVFKSDGFPRAKLFQSAKAAVPRGVAPEAISGMLQSFVKAELDKFEFEAETHTPDSTPTQASLAVPDEVRKRRIQGAYARRNHKRGGAHCVQNFLKQWGKARIEDLDDYQLKKLLDALDKLPEG